MTKILNNRKLRNNSKWLKYRHLLYKHGLHNFDEDNDDELYHAIWADKQNKNKRNVLMQTSPLHIQQKNTETQSPSSPSSFTSATKKSNADDDDETMMTTFGGDTSLANLYSTPAANEMVYTFGSTDDEKSPSPSKLAEEHEKQRKYMSANISARRLLIDNDIRNNVTDINPDEFDDVGTEWKHRSFLTEEEQRQLEPKNFLRHRRKTGEVAKKLIKNHYSTNGGDVSRKLNFSFPKQSTPKTHPRVRKVEKAPSSASTLKDHFKVVKTPAALAQQKGSGRSKILRWECYR